MLCKVKIIWCCTLFMLGSVVAPYAHCQDTSSISANTFRITSSPANQFFPSIDGNKIVWIDDRNGYPNSDIYLYDLGLDGKPGTHDLNEGEYQITTSPGFQTEPQIQDNRIVYIDFVGLRSQVRMYHLGADGKMGTHDQLEGDYAITNNNCSHLNPHIFNNTITYLEGCWNQFQLWIYNLGEDGIPGTADAGEQVYALSYFDGSTGPGPLMSKNKVAWCTHDFLGEIQLYNFGKDGIPETGDKGEGQYVLAQGSNEELDGVAALQNTVAWSSRNYSDPASLHFAYLGADGIPNTRDRGEGALSFTPALGFYFITAPILSKNYLVWEGSLLEAPSDNSTKILALPVRETIAGSLIPVLDAQPIELGGNGPKGSAAIWRNRVVYHESAGGNYDIYLAILKDRS